MHNTMAGHYHLATAATQNQGNMLGDRPSVRVSKQYLKDTSGSSMKQFLSGADGGSSKPRSKKSKDSARPESRGSSSNWRTMHGHGGRGARGVAGALSSSRATPNSKPSLRLDMQKVNASREKRPTAGACDSPLPHPRGSTAEDENASPVLSPAEKIKASRIPQKQQQGSRIPKPSARAPKTKRAAAPPTTIQNNQASSSSGQVPNQGVIPGSVEPTELKKGVIHKSKSTGITVHKPQISAEPLVLNKPAKATRPAAIARPQVVTETGERAGTGIPGLSDISWKASNF